MSLQELKYIVSNQNTKTINNANIIIDKLNNGGILFEFTYDNTKNDAVVKKTLDDINSILKSYSKSNKDYKESIIIKIDNLLQYINTKFKKVYNIFNIIKYIFYIFIIISILTTFIVLHKFNKFILQNYNTIAKQIEEKKILEGKKLNQMNELLKNIGHHWKQPLSLISIIASTIKLNLELDIFLKEEISKNMDLILDSSQKLANIVDGLANNFFDNTTIEEIEKKIFVEKIHKISTDILEKDCAIHIFDKSTSKILRLNTYHIYEIIKSLIQNANNIFQERKIVDKQISINIIEEKNVLIFELCDNAGGIDETIIDRIFEPYFTTFHQSFNKGLSLYYNKQVACNILGGNLEAFNTDNGACFILTLPY